MQPGINAVLLLAAQHVALETHVFGRTITKLLQCQLYDVTVPNGIIKQLIIDKFMPLYSQQMD